MTDPRDAWLEAAADRFGTPAFVYFPGDIERRAQALRTAFEARFELSYAVKSNPNPALLSWMDGRVDGLDVSSIGEFRLAVSAGWDPARISFTGPAKRNIELDEAIAAGLGHLVVESVEEARIANSLARLIGRIQPVLLRIAPDRVPRGFGDHMAGRPCPFGIDIEVADEAVKQILRMPSLALAGFHIFSGTQSLSAEGVANNYRIFLECFAGLCARHGLAPHMLVFGSGLGIAYHEQDQPIDLGAVAGDILPDLARFCAAPAFQGTRLVLELGRYLVAEAGFFLTSVVAVKESRGSRIAICDGGMNNHLPASGHFGMVMRRNYRMHKLGGSGPLEKVDLVGPLCTSIDKLASAIELPRLERGDVIAVENSGAYGLTASPIHFISHAPPAELMVDEGGLRNISRPFFAAPDASRLGVQPERRRA